jgi:HSP20 family molecular chaperone IbpA
MDLVDDPTTNTLIAIFELPGIKTGDITLQIRDGNLIIMGERRPPPAVQQALATRQSTNLPRNPISAADSLARGEMDTESDDAAGTTRSISVTIHELRFGQFYRAIPIPTGLKVSLLLMPTACHDLID